MMNAPPTSHDRGVDSEVAFDNPRDIERSERRRELLDSRQNQEQQDDPQSDGEADPEAPDKSLALRLTRFDSMEI